MLSVATVAVSLLNRPVNPVALTSGVATRWHGLRPVATSTPIVNKAIRMSRAGRNGTAKNTNALITIGEIAAPALLSVILAEKLSLIFFDVARTYILDAVEKKDDARPFVSITIIQTIKVCPVNNTASDSNLKNKEKTIIFFTSNRLTNGITKK